MLDMCVFPRDDISEIWRFYRNQKLIINHSASGHGNMVDRRYEDTETGYILTGRISTDDG